MGLMKINRTAKIAYHCSTEELALLFLKECDNKHIYWPWPNREKATSKTKWSINKENTCYIVEGNTLSVAHEDYLKQYGIKIIDVQR